MIVAVDARHLAGGRGVAHYTAALLDALARAHPEDTYRAYVPGRRTPQEAAGSGTPHDEGVRPLYLGGRKKPQNVAERGTQEDEGVRPRVVRGRVPSRVVFGAAAVAGWPRVDRLVGGADVVWIPAPAPVAVSPGVPYVLSVHDLSWIERPGDFTVYERLWHRVARIERLARRAAAVVCVSEATRAAVLRTWRLDPARVHVVLEGVTAPGAGGAPAGGPAAAGAPAGGRPYVLAVGALEPRKAPDLLVRAHRRAREQGLAADLVFAGEGRLAPRLQGDGVHVLGRVDDVGPLLRGALALAMPSHLEGFGLPPLEAALAGTPSIVADLAVYDETLGDAALRFPAGDERALAAALLAVERDAALRERLAAAARERAGRLTWERSAARLHAILAQAAAR